MFCENCGKESVVGKKFCTNCGHHLLAATNNIDDSKNSAPSIPLPSESSPVNVSRIVQILVVLAIIGWGAYSSQNDKAVQTNNDALSAFDSGNTQLAINQFQEAGQSATDNQTKIEALKNLGYAYSTDGKASDALASFREALSLTKVGTTDYYLISGEIAVLEGKPNAAYVSLMKAYEINPDDMQTNNALGLFHLDLEDTHPDFVDYKKALSYLQRVSGLSTLETAKQNLGIAYYFNDNYDQAISTLSSISLDKESYTAFWLGLTYASKDDVANAKYYLQKAVNSGIELPQEVYDYLTLN